MPNPMREVREALGLTVIQMAARLICGPQNVYHRQAEADYRQHLRTCTWCKTGKAETCSTRIQLYRQAENAEQRAIKAGVPL